MDAYAIHGEMITCPFVSIYLLLLLAIDIGDDCPNIPIAKLVAIAAQGIFDVFDPAAGRDICWNGCCSGDDHEEQKLECHHGLPGVVS